MTHTDVTEDVRFLLAAGTHPDVIAARLDTTVAALAKRFQRHGPAELSAVFGRAERAARKAGRAGPVDNGCQPCDSARQGGML